MIEQAIDGGIINFDALEISKIQRMLSSRKNEKCEVAKVLSNPAFVFARLHEFDESVGLVREGIGRVVPVPLLSLFTGPELETLVCGRPEISVNLLRSVVTYKGISHNAPLIKWFWELMEEFTDRERSLFLRFVWGRARLPRTIADFRGRDFVIQVSWIIDVLAGTSAIKNILYRACSSCKVEVGVNSTSYFSTSEKPVKVSCN